MKLCRYLITVLNEPEYLPRVSDTCNPRNEYQRLAEGPVLNPQIGHWVRCFWGGRVREGWGWGSRVFGFTGPKLVQNIVMDPFGVRAPDRALRFQDLRCIVATGSSRGPLGATPARCLPSRWHYWPNAIFGPGRVPCLRKGRYQSDHEETQKQGYLWHVTLRARRFFQIGQGRTPHSNKREQMQIMDMFRLGLHINAALEHTHTETVQQKHTHAHTETESAKCLWGIVCKFSVSVAFLVLSAEGWAGSR